MPRAEAYFHFVWATKYRQNTINPSVEKIIFETIRDKSSRLQSPIHAINAAYDHLHIAVTVAPSIAVSKWVGQVKAFSSYNVNRELTQLETPFHWQNDYSYHTLGKKHCHFF